MKKKINKQILLTLLLTFLCFGAVSVQAEDGAEENSVGSIVLSVEKFTIGQGYLIEPHVVPIYSGDNCAKVFDRFIKDHGYKYENSGRLNDSFYLSSIYNGDNGKTFIPSCILRMEPALLGNEWVLPEDEIPNFSNTGADLGEFSYGQMSGWYFSYNDEFPNVSMSGITPADGGIMRVQYTVWGFGADLGNEYEGNPAPLEIADKSALIRKVAEIQSEKERYGQAYQDAIDVLADLEADAWDVEDCLERLNEGPSVSPSLSPGPSRPETGTPSRPETGTPSPGPVKKPTATPTKPSRSTWVTAKNQTVSQGALKGSKVDTKKDKTATIREVKATSAKTVTIPSAVTVGGMRYKVTAIGGQAFKKAKKATKIILPGTLKSVGANAFKGASKVKAVTVKSLKQKLTLEKNAFAAAGSLKTLTFQNGKASWLQVKKGAFKGLKTKNMTIRVKKSTTPGQLKKMQKTFKNAGFKGRVRR